MPELPEVEVTKRALSPHLEGNTIEKLDIRETRLRWPIRVDLLKKIEHKIVTSITRRGKYILINTSSGTAMIHLGMSGSMGIFDQFVPPKKHDHFDIHLSNKKIIRFNDPRRFGCFVWAGKQPEKHKLICHLGLEPLEKDFRGEYLYKLSKHRKTNIKAFIMNARVVVGVGNIYASEALFLSGIHPKRRANNIGKIRYQNLVHCIKSTLTKSIEMGGTTLRNFSFTYGEEKIGYFKQSLFVYGRDGEECGSCGTAIRRIVLSGRGTFYCRKCQR